MSQPLQLTLMLVLLIPFWYKLSRDFVSGLSYGMVVLVACTHFLRIPLPGALPELTIHRIILISLLLVWTQTAKTMRLSDVPLARNIKVWAGIAFISLIGSIDYVNGIKRYFDYVLEFFLLYFICSTTLRSSGDALRLLRSTCIGLGIVAALAIWERYTGFNPVDMYFYAGENPSYTKDVTSTYRHRILLGTGMAMGWPLTFYFALSAGSARTRLIAGTLTAGLLTTCYFAMSRGPWLASIIAASFLAAFGSTKARKTLCVFGAVACLLLLARPGVFDTVFGLASATVNVDSHKGATFLYRLELWEVALSEVFKSPWRLLFGYGPGAGASQSLTWALSYRDRDFEVQSWDNDLAYALYQYGFLGLAATIALYSSICWKLLSMRRRVSGANRDLFACLSASALVLFFMMSNVMIFARQLYYLLWAVTAIGFVLSRGFQKTESKFEQSLCDLTGAARL